MCNALRRRGVPASSTGAIARVREAAAMEPASQRAAHHHPISVGACAGEIAKLALAFRSRAGAAVTAIRPSLPRRN